MIVAVAIKLADGRLYSLPKPSRHCHVIWKIVEETGLPFVSGETQGFLKENGEFLDREAAMLDAYKSGQISSLKDELFSEDVW